MCDAPPDEELFLGARVGPMPVTDRLRAWLRCNRDKRADEYTWMDDAVYSESILDWCACGYNECCAPGQESLASSLDDHAWLVTEMSVTFVEPPVAETTEVTRHAADGKLDDRRAEMARQMQPGQCPAIGVACDACGTELVNRQPDTMLESCPPQIAIGCPGCGFTGYKHV